MTLISDRRHVLYRNRCFAIAICTTCANLIFGKYWQSSSAGITAADYLPDYWNLTKTLQNENRNSNDCENWPIFSTHTKFCVGEIHVNQEGGVCHLSTKNMVENILYLTINFIN